MGKMLVNRWLLGGKNSNFLIFKTSDLGTDENGATNATSPQRFYRDNDEQFRKRRFIFHRF